jgi:outer membrane protein insertion porin family
MMHRSVPAGAFAALTLLAGCARAPNATAKNVPVAPVAVPLPPCPTSILGGGDPLESLGFEGKKVVRVCIVGGTEQTRKSAERAIELRPSETYDAERVRGDLEAIMKLGTFDDASAYGLLVQQGASVVLFYEVRDRPTIAAVSFEGAKVLGNDALAAKLPIAKNSVYDPVKLNLVKQAVRDEYRARGYDAVRVVHVAEPLPKEPGQVDVRIKVDEGPQWHFTKIDLRGNKRVPEAELRKILGLKIGQPFIRDEVERASLLVSALYFDRGMIQMRIAADSGGPAVDGGLAVTFEIDEGDVYTISALHATKLGAPAEKELLEKVVRARPKQVFSRTALIQDIERVKAFFESRTKQHVEVTPLTEVDAAKKSVDVTLQVEAF